MGSVGTDIKMLDFHHKTMIAYLRGQIVRQDDKYIVLNVNGVGYKVFCNTLHPNFLNQGDLEFFIHTVVREDALELFGFFEQTSLKLFEKLINISGIGPRSALGIVNVGTIESLTEAINKGDLGYLTAVSGIGKKTAEKIILELRGQVSDISFTDSNNEVVQALRAMGYSERDAQVAAKNVTGNTTQEKIKSALKQAGK
jgi:Holliday junction DNA helicase RuvA